MLTADDAARLGDKSRQLVVDVPLLVQRARGQARDREQDLDESENNSIVQIRLLVEDLSKGFQERNAAPAAVTVPRTGNEQGLPSPLAELIDVLFTVVDE